MRQVFPNYNFAQYISVFAASLGGLSAGTVIAWSANVNYLKQNKEFRQFTIDIDDLPLAAAMLNLGAMVFAIPSGKLADYVGRLPTMMLAMILFLINWLLIAFANNLATVVVARFLGGMAMGCVCVVNNMYLLEICSIENRRLCSGFSFSMGVGIVFQDFIALFTYWREYHLLPIIMPILYIFVFFLLPESPTFLVARGKIEQAKKSLQRIRDEKEVLRELKGIQEARTRATKIDSNGFRKLFLEKSNLHALCAGLGVSTYQQLTNIDGFSFYATSVFNASGTLIPPTISTMIMFLVQVIATFPVIVLLEKAKRKFFLVLSASIMVFSHFGLGIYFHLKDNSIYISLMEYIPLCLAVLFMVGFSLGYGTVPWILSSELFVPEVRGYGSGIIVVANWGTAFLVTYFFPAMLNQLGYYYTFYIFGALAVLSIFFVIFVVPETKGRTFLIEPN